MSLPIVLTIISSFIWAITSHIDKYVLCKIDNYQDSLKTMLIFSTFVSGLILSPFWLIKLNFNITISLTTLIVIIISSIFYLLSMLFYFLALEKNDTSIVVVMFQLVPIFSYLLSRIFFNELLSIKQIIGAFIIILSTIVISYDFNNCNNKNKTIALILMIFSSMFEALYYFTFEVSMRLSNFSLCAFWYQIMLLLIGIILFNFKGVRKSFSLMLHNNGKKFFMLNTINELLNLISNLLVNFANLYISIAILNTLNGFQGIFVFIIGFIGTILFPKFICEDIKGDTLLQKLLCIIFSIIGVFIMFY